METFAIKNPHEEQTDIDACIETYMKESGFTASYLKNTKITINEFSHITNISTFNLLQDIFDQKLSAFRTKQNPSQLWLNYYDGLKYYYQRALPPDKV